MFLNCIRWKSARFMCELSCRVKTPYPGRPTKIKAPLPCVCVVVEEEPCLWVTGSRHLRRSLYGWFSYVAHKEGEPFNVTTAKYSVLSSLFASYTARVDTVSNADKTLVPATSLFFVFKKNLLLFHGQGTGWRA